MRRDVAHNTAQITAVCGLNLNQQRGFRCLFMFFEKWESIPTSFQIKINLIHKLVMSNIEINIQINANLFCC